VHDVSIPPMGILKKIAFISLTLLTLNIAEARPISWSGGSTLMYKSNSMFTSYYYHYSPSYKYSIGAEYIDDKYFKDDYLNLRATYLMDRKNTKQSQRNLYFTAGISSKSKNSFHYGVHGDWETRRVFTSFSYINKHRKIKNYTENEFQIGFAPYIGEYNDLHTWIMLKTKKDTLNNIWETYPFVKFFKGDVLIEIGYKSSHWDVHYMMRF
jgi:hypothetical protein|tara:strand:+ start:96 stop:728 length:633 start_codon:yes stop_codon:yes gene_type:complete